MLIGFIAAKATSVSVGLLKTVLSAGVRARQERRALKAEKAKTQGKLHPGQEMDFIHSGSVTPPPTEVCCTRREWEEALKKGHFNEVVLARGQKREHVRKKTLARMSAGGP